MADVETPKEPETPQEPDVEFTDEGKQEPEVSVERIEYNFWKAVTKIWIETLHAALILAICYMVYTFSIAGCQELTRDSEKDNNYIIKMRELELKEMELKKKAEKNSEY